jgi:hypothetical protein
MPALEAQDYERFSYDEAPLTLDEAVKKANDLRRKDSANFYRVEHTDDARTTFTVTKIPVSSVYADFIARVAKVMGRYVLRSK